MTIRKLIVGVLSLQGDFSKHIEALLSLGVKTKEVRTPEDLKGCDGLIIPGGESTVIMRQLDFIQLTEPLKDFAKDKPVFGTCAGLILMSSEIKDSNLKPLKLLDLTIERNAFGRQADSFEAFVELELEPTRQKLFHAFFIRAPRIRSLGSEIQVLGKYKEESILIRQGHHLGATFHPELTNDPLIHQYFIDLFQ